MQRSASLAAGLHQASQLVARVAAGRSLSAELARAGEQDGGASRAALVDLTHGTLRRYGRVQRIVRDLSNRGSADAALEALLWCSLYALESGRFAAHTVVDQAVHACALGGHARAKGYVNGVLRSYLRARKQLEAHIAADPEAKHQHPHWWIDAVRTAYPADWERMLEAGNSHPPMCLRVNRRRIGIEAYAAKLAAAGIEARAVGPQALLLAVPLPVERLPGFAQGEVSVQDAGAQRAAGLLELADGQRVLDACAAPGGKAAHILECASVALTALDADAERSARMPANLARLGLAASVHAADCTEPARWWDGQPYERILADVPCSGSGIARRHPDIKWLRRAADAGAFALRQGAILDALWRVLARGGKLLYVTCSVFPEENGAVVDAFCARAPALRRCPLPGDAPAQLMPCAEHDGFYFALLEKQA